MTGVARGRRTTLLVAPLLAVAACGGAGAVETDDLEAQVVEQLDVEADEVDCPDELPAEVDAEVRCRMGSGTAVLVATEVADDRVRFEIVREVPADALATRVSELLAQQVGQAPDSVGCPDPVLLRDGEATRCTLVAGEDEYGVDVAVEGDGESAQLAVEVDQTPAS